MYPHRNSATKNIKCGEFLKRRNDYTEMGKSEKKLIIMKFESSGIWKLQGMKKEEMLLR